MQSFELESYPLVSRRPLFLFVAKYHFLFLQTASYNLVPRFRSPSRLFLQQYCKNKFLNISIIWLTKYFFNLLNKLASSDFDGQTELQKHGSVVFFRIVSFEIGHYLEGRRSGMLRIFLNKYSHYTWQDNIYCLPFHQQFLVNLAPCSFG